MAYPTVSAVPKDCKRRINPYSPRYGEAWTLADDLRGRGTISELALNILSRPDRADHAALTDLDREIEHVLDDEPGEQVQYALALIRDAAHSVVYRVAS